MHSLVLRKEGHFNVVIVQLNGELQDRRAIFTLVILADAVKLRFGTKTKYKADYSNTMQACGARWVFRITIPSFT